MNIGKRAQRIKGIQAALASAFFLGLAPIFGKQAILFGFPPLAVVAMRTVLAAALLTIIMFIFRRQYFFIYPAGLLGCFLAGGINGVGSLFYYEALGRIDAGLGHLLYALYPIFVAFWLRLDRQPLSKITIFRLILTIPALFLLTQTQGAQIDFLGMGMMLMASALYALHLPINQRVLYDMPAPTVTLYTLISMSLVVLPAAFIAGSLPLEPFQSFDGFPNFGWIALIALTLVTFLSRLMLFLGVKHLGGLQTALLGLSELIVTILFAQAVLGERFSFMQWLGMLLLITSLLLVKFEKSSLKRPASGGLLHWLRPPGLPAEIQWQPQDK